MSVASVKRRNCGRNQNCKLPEAVAALTQAPMNQTAPEAKPATDQAQKKP